MIHHFLFPALGVFALLTGGPEKTVQAQGQKIIVVNVEVTAPADAPKAYSSAFDKGKVELEVDFDDPLYTLNDFILEEDELQGPDCFMPEIKLIYQDYTYIISLYCTSVKKYQNSAPYVTSSKLLTNDLQVTESVLSTLSSIRKKYFNASTNSKVAATFVQRKPLPPLDTNVDDVTVPDDTDSDADLDAEANKNDGMFDDDDPKKVGQDIENDFKVKEDEN